MRNVLIVSIFVFLACDFSSADEILLYNGDKITGDVIEEADSYIKIQTQAMGVVEVNKAYLKAEDELEVKEEKSKDVMWDKKISIGYTKSSGNTNSSNGHAKLSLHRKTSSDELSAEIGADISTSSKQLDSKKFNGLLRYAFSFGEELKWYNFYEITGEQDVFADVDYRIVPSVGVGYWFSDEDDLKVMAEGAIGYEYTKYIKDGSSDEQVVLVPRGYLEKSLWGSSKATQDLYLYPSLSDTEKYRIHSETAFVNPIKENVDLKVSFIDDYNSSPAGGYKKNDYRLITSVEVGF